jgi:hypothetical protein
VLAVLELANRILSSAILITAFSLALYILKHNLRSAVGRAFCILLASVMVVYLGDAAVLGIASTESAVTWLKFQWVGIAFVPAVYLHLSDALLNVTNSNSKWRFLAVRLSYLGSGLTLLAVILTPWIVEEVPDPAPLLRMQAGPLFWIFTLYFFTAVVSGAVNINRARTRCMTSTSRRRMAYLTASFAAPALGVFPYMLLTTLPGSLPGEILMTILVLGNVGIAFMIVVMAYAVAYFGAFNPDRVIKYGLIEYLLRGPLVASLVLVILVTMPRIGNILGLPGSILTLITAVGTIILTQMAVNLARPFLNRLVYRQDLEEITWLQELDKRLLTPSDLEQYLENVLSQLAESLRVRRAYLVTMDDGGLQVEACCGERAAAQAFLQSHDLGPVFQRCQQEPRPSPAFYSIDGHMLRPLYTQGHDALLGLLIVARGPFAPRVDDQLSDDAAELIEQAETALQDRHLQQGIFVALQQIMPDIERIQKQRQLMRYVTSLPQPINSSPVNDPSFARWVKDALSHYWGGPKLTRSPLLDLRIVRAARAQYEEDPVRALRTVLQQAIEALRPVGEQKMTAAEWTLYNILDLKYRQGRRMREIAHRLAVSESDLYRKQRAAIGEVARTLSEMERQSSSS